MGDSRTEQIENVLQIRRCACVVKGGRRFSFTGLVVIGDGHGTVAWGYGKGSEVPIAVEKATRASERNRITVSLVHQTLPHRVVGHFGASKVLLLPASPGTGIIAGGVVRSVLKCVGITDVLTKSFGSNCPLTLVKAVFDGLCQLRMRQDVARLRGIEL